MSERRKQILDKILQNGEVRVDELIKEYDVSVETIRRDLRILDHQGFVRRKYGGAERKATKAEEVPYADRLVQHQPEKEAIAKEAVKLLNDGDCVFIEGKTSALTLAKMIPASLELTVVTNSIAVAQELTQHKKKCSVYLPGGEVGENGIMTGLKTHQGLTDFHVDKAFFSAIAFNEKGVFYTRAEPQHLAKVLREISTQLILLADSSKFDKIAFLHGLKLSELDYIITDEGVPAAFAANMESTETELVIAKCEEK